MAGLAAAALLSMAGPAAAQDAPQPPAAQSKKPAAQAPAAKLSPQALAAQKAAAAKTAALRAQIAAKTAAQKAAALNAARLAKKAGKAKPAARPGGAAQATQAPVNGDELFARDTPDAAAAAQPAAVAGSDSTQAADPKGDARSSDEDLTKSLSAYGKWLTDPSYGSVWVPDADKVGKNFTPYVSGGHWSLDNSAWSWASDYPFGNTVFHYGNWAWLNSVAGSSAEGSSRKGWAWVPGRTFAPAWVVWRLGEPGYDFVGWAPIPPKAPEKTGDGDASDTPPGAVTQPVLPYFFAPTRRLFSRALESSVLTDRALGQEVLGHSKIFDGNKVDGASAFVPASPSLHDARIKALRKIVLSAAGASEPSEFAAPPPAAQPAQQAAQPQGDAPRPTYRCHLLSTRPRAWRCGYE